jgi:hypothetical protein
VRSTAGRERVRVRLSRRACDNAKSRRYYEENREQLSARMVPLVEGERSLFLTVAAAGVIQPL